MACNYCFPTRTTFIMAKVSHALNHSAMDVNCNGCTSQGKQFVVPVSTSAGQRLGAVSLHTNLSRGVFVAAFLGSLLRHRVLGVDQEPRGRYEVVETALLVGQDARLVPLVTVLPADERYRGYDDSRVLTSTYGYLRVLTGTYGYLRVLTGTYLYLRVLTDTHEHLRVLTGTNGYLWVPTGTYRYLRVLFCLLATWVAYGDSSGVPGLWFECPIDDNTVWGVS